MVKRNVCRSRFRDGERRLSLIFLIYLLFALGFWSFAALAPATQPEEKGEEIFEKKCVLCHTIGKGNRVGPDLSGVTKRREKDWLFRFIEAPGKMISKKDPVALDLLKKFNNIRMPDLGLPESDVRLIISYLEAKSAVQPERTTPTPLGDKSEIGGTGDPIEGMKLFTGAVRLTNGGAPCISCHTVRSLNALGGGTLGPDLSGIYEDYEDDGISSILESLPFTTMEPIYGEHPLSKKEQAHLKAFFKAEEGEKTTASTLSLPLIVGGIVIGLLLLVQVLWSKRLRAVRKTLVKGD